MNPWVIGIDEAGRGPLAGPVYVALIGIKKKDISNFVKNGERVTKSKLKDSKKLSEKQRNKWKKYILSQRAKCFFAVRSSNSKVIDSKGISSAVRRCVAGVLKGVNEKDQILLDGSLFAPKRYLNQKTIIRGDENIPIISLASILAKTARDKRITSLAKQYKKYGLEVHKGYGTKEHIRAIKKYGMCEIHRKSFCKGILTNR